MEPIYAETINSFANDLDNLWKDKNKFGSGKQLTKDDDNCTQKRFMLSAKSGSSNSIDSLSCHKNAEVLNNVDRLAKTASIWTRPDLTRQETDEILQEFEKGIFIVRMTTTQTTMVLSYRSEDKVQHVLIKVNVTKGFYMDGSQNIFRNVNLMIAHYMSHPIQGTSLFLKLPRVLREATNPAHFKFLKNLKLDFWKTSLANKGVDEIWDKKSVQNDNVETNSSPVSKIEEIPSLPPREYSSNDLNIIQGNAEISIEDSCVYKKIEKRKKEKIVPNLQDQTASSNDARVDMKNTDRIYSELWNWKSDENSTVGSKQLETPGNLSNLKLKKNENKLEHKHLIKKEQITKNCLFSIPGLIKNYYPELINEDGHNTDRKGSAPSLLEDIKKIKSKNHPDEFSAFDVKSGPTRCTPPEDLTKVTTKINQKEQPTSEKTANKQPVTSDDVYETPWDVQAPWITKLMDIDNSDPETNSRFMTGIIKATTLDVRMKPLELSSIYDMDYLSQDQNLSNNLNDLRISSNTEDEDDVNENKLQQELLAEIQPVMFSPTVTHSVHNQVKNQYGQSIRKHLIQLCSSNSTISNSIQIFIKCTIDRSDLSPYTSMRLIRQYMSGLRNFITQQKSELSLLSVIEEERNRTPKNVFINLDSIMESVLTKAVMKPLIGYVYRLLIHEHYKNNSMKLISDGLEAAKRLGPTKLGLPKSSKPIIDPKIKIIQRKLKLISATYSPEKKISHFISIMEIVFEMMKVIFPNTKSDVLRCDVKTDSLLSILVYIFSQCKKGAIAVQCEIEYIEGLLWSSSLVNGEPGFYLMNIMSSLEAIMVLGRPLSKSTDVVDFKNCETAMSNSLSAIVGSVNVIILDEKINRLVTKTFPVRSNVNARSLCNAIAHRLGIFNPMEYSLYKLTGSDDELVDDYDYPTKIKQNHQQLTKETLTFLFKRKNATFILPLAVAVQ